MAIVSIHKIVTTQDRIVLDQEYNTIINRLALGNIESDYELTALYTEMMNFITGKVLRQEEAKRFQERYNRREQRQVINALSGIRAYGGNLWSWLGSLATSCISQYFSYENSKAELLEGLDEDLWKLRKEDIENCNDLQVRLLNASWNLLRQYKLPDEYRLTQDSLNGFLLAINEPEPAKRLRMLKARNVARNFQVYPPYWFYRAMAAHEIKDETEASSCFAKFEEIWRPVLRYDPYKLEAEKYKVQKLAGENNPDKDKIRKHLETVRDYTQDEDWGNNLFAGIAYFLLGDNDEGISCVEPNVDFGYEKDVSSIFLSEMKEGKLDAFALFALKDDLKTAIDKAQAKQAEAVKAAKAESKRRKLTKEEIVKITTRYGYNAVPNNVTAEDFDLKYSLEEGDKLYATNRSIPSKGESGFLHGIQVGINWGQSMATTRHVDFWSSGIVTSVKKDISAYIAWSAPVFDHLSYDDLRNNPKFTLEYLREIFDGYDDNFFKALMELKELE